MNPILSISRQQRRGTRSATTGTRRAATVREWPGSPDKFPWDRIAFGRSPVFQDPANENAWTVTIQPGAIRFHGLADREMTDSQDVVLLAETCSIYVEATLSSPDAPLIKVAASVPLTNNTHVRVKLYTYIYQPATGTYGKPYNHHFGDVHFGAPML